MAHVAASDVSLRYLLLNQMLFLQAAGYQVTSVAARGADAPVVEAAGIRYLEVPISRRYAPLADLRALWRLYRLFRRERFSIVHTHTPKGGLLGQYAALFARVPVRVHTIHGLYFPGDVHPRWHGAFVWLERITMRFAHLALSQNPEDIPVAVRERICRPDQIELLGNGVDVHRFDPARYTPEQRHRIRASLGLGPEHVVIGAVARFVREKGYGELLEAARIVRAAAPAARFLFVGAVENFRGDGLDPAVIDELGLSDVVQFLGHRSDVVDLYAAMDMLALPSYREGFPRAPMEAAAMGLPVVASDIRGCRQTVDPGVTGYLVPVRDAHALAEALLALVRDAPTRTRFGESARRKAVAEFDEGVVFERIRRAYAELLARSPRRPSSSRAAAVARRAEA